jgi:hypothetical protein
MEGDPTRLEEQMGVMMKQCPRITGSTGIGEYRAHPCHTPVFVHLIAEDPSPFDTTDDDVVEHTFGIETGVSGHDQSSQPGKGPVKSY